MKKKKNFLYFMESDYDDEIDENKFNDLFF